MQRRMYLEWGVRQPKISIIFEFRERRAWEVHEWTPSACQIHPQTRWSRLAVSLSRQPQPMLRNPNFRKNTLKSQLEAPNRVYPVLSKTENSFHVTLANFNFGRWKFAGAHNSCQILRNYAWGNSRANGGVWDGVYAPRFRQPTPISFGNFRKFPKISVTREHTKIKVLLVRLWHSNVSAPSARWICFKHWMMCWKSVCW